MKKRIVFVGGGSSKFVRNIAMDLFQTDVLKDIHIVLMDIDRERLEISEKLVRKLIQEMGVPATCSATTDRRQALEGADYVIITVMVGGFRKYDLDVAIPAKYGVFQPISDSTGPGALMRIVRTAPVLIGLAEDLRAVAPDAWVLNYANPMAMNTKTLLRAGHARTIGLCHSIQGTVKSISRWLDLDPARIEFRAGGINHIDFYLTLRCGGRDIYPDLLAAEERIVREKPAERVRFELLRALGYFPAEGASHQAEYSAWFMKDEATGKAFGVEAGTGYRVDLQNAIDKRQEALDIISGKKPLVICRSDEYAASILCAMENAGIMEIYGNVANTGLIGNLPPDAVVEVPCLIGRNSCKPCHVGRLPAQLAAMMTPHVFLYELAVDAVFKRDRRILLQALQADPLTSAVLTLRRMREMLDEMCAANSEYLADWK